MHKKKQELKRKLKLEKEQRERIKIIQKMKLMRLIK
jgi:hypothetical protein